MTSDFQGKNLYAILGINPAADKDTIKNAYRNLAKKYHPDTNKGNKASEKKFKEVAQAYEILSDNKKRTDYDRLNGYNQKTEHKTNYSTQNQAKQAYSKQKNTNPEKNKEQKYSQQKETKKESQKNKKDTQFAETFSKFVNDVFAQKPENNKKAINGSDITIDLTITVHEAKNGAVRRVNVLHTEVCPNCKGKKFINGTNCKKCNGNGEISSQKTMLVKIPPEIKQNEKVMLKNEGNVGLYGGINGDLYLKINIEKNELFRYEDLNVLSDVAITPSEAALGTNIMIPSIDGHINMKIPAETSSGQKLRLHEQGIFEKDGKKRGDHIVTVIIKMPKNLTQQEKDLYKKLSELREFNPRKENKNE